MARSLLLMRALWLPVPFLLCGAPHRPARCCAAELPIAMVGPSNAFTLLLERGELRAGAIAVGGHRGMGENLVGTAEGGARALRFRENTVRSLNEAAAAGASFVEFDVQVTADGAPVIWHDDFVATRAPGGAPEQRHIAQLTLADFRRLARPGRAPADACASAGAADTPGDVEGGSAPAEAACRADGGAGELVRLVGDGAGGRAAAPWAVEVDDSLPTLAEGVPEAVGFDIEVKMATPDDLAATPQAEVDRMVGPILAQVERAAAGSARTIIFTSFDPDICRALLQRQRRDGVLFLSGGGKYVHADARRTSVGAAVAFAAEAGLQGLVLEAGEVLAQPAAMAAAREKGLMVLTYGRQNNDPAMVRQQAGLGVQAVIVDDVARIVAALERAPSEA